MTLRLNLVFFMTVMMIYTRMGLVIYVWEHQYSKRGEAVRKKKGLICKGEQYKRQIDHVPFVQIDVGCSVAQLNINRN